MRIVAITIAGESTRVGSFTNDFVDRLGILALIALDGASVGGTGLACNDNDVGGEMLVVAVNPPRRLKEYGCGFGIQSKLIGTQIPFLRRVLVMSLQRGSVGMNARFVNQLGDRVHGGDSVFDFDRASAASDQAEHHNNQQHNNKNLLHFISSIIVWGVSDISVN